jgi:hypothetical protein
LLVWLVITFVLPLLLVFALRPDVLHRRSVWTMQSEIVSKSITAFFVVLATWLVARLQKRPLDDFGIPPRQAFGRRFWEGILWGFTMLSAVLLVLHALGNFQIHSVGLTGSACFKYALGWAFAF